MPAARSAARVSPSTITTRPCGVSTWSGRTLGTRDHQVVVLRVVGITEAERQLAVRLVLPQLHELVAAILALGREVRAGELAVRGLLEPGGVGEARRDARRVADHPRDVREQ